MLSISGRRERVGREFHDQTPKGPAGAEVWKILCIWPQKQLPEETVLTGHRLILSEQSLLS